MLYSRSLLVIYFIYSSVYHSFFQTLAIHVKEARHTKHTSYDSVYMKCLEKNMEQKADLLLPRAGGRNGKGVSF